nr:hypothetical protein [Sphingomonas sanxanigenens]
MIATASRPETQDWVKELGAHHVLDHSKPLAAQVEALGIGAEGAASRRQPGPCHIMFNLPV